MNRIALGLTLMLSTALASAESPEGWAQKVDPVLLQTQSGSNTEFLLVLTERADVGGASSFASKKAKGQYVFEQLSQTAARTQRGIVEELRTAGAQYRSFWIDNMVWVLGDSRLIRTLAQRTEVARIITNSNSRLPINVDIPLDVQVPTNVEWNLAALRVTNVWALGFNGQGVVVGGQDTGYQWDHPALIKSYRGWDGTNVDHNYNWHDAIHSTTNYNRCGVNLLSPCDDVGHGTHTMGTMVGDDGGTNNIGMAPGARWIGCRNMNWGLGSVASYLECFQWFLAPTDLMGQNPDPSKAPDIINNSWGCLRSEGCTDPAVLLRAVENVCAAGIVVVAGAGNDGPGCSTISAPPAIYGSVLTVGGLTMPGRVDPYSGRGPVVVDGSNRLKPNVCALDNFIRSSFPTNTYYIMGGTSVASAHASGLVALVLSAHPELKGQVDALTRLIEQTAVPMTNSQTCDGTSSTNVPNVVSGWGGIDALAALALGDSDSDGIPDWWMIAHFGHAVGLASDQSRSLDDPDGDGMSNLEEYIAGTDPLDAQSFFHVVAEVSGGSVAVTFQSSLGRRYTLTSMDVPATGGFVPVAGQVDVRGTGEVVVMNDIRSLAVCRFYRVDVKVDPGPGA